MQLERRESVALGQPHVLTEEEARWCGAASALKQAGIPAPASDYELAIFALVGKADTAKSVQRVTRFNATVAKHGSTAQRRRGKRAWGWNISPTTPRRRWASTAKAGPSSTSVAPA